MSAKLIILGLLREGRAYGYEIKRTMEHEHMAEWADISYGAIYSALNQLAADGFIEKVATEKTGKRPSRDVYQITGTGDEEFLRLLREALTSIESKPQSIDLGLRFMAALPTEEVEALIANRKEKIKEVLSELGDERSWIVSRHEQASYLELVCAIVDHGIGQLETEIQWLDGVLDKLRQGLLP